MSSADGDGPDDEGADFLGQVAQLGHVEAADVGRRMDLSEGYGSGRRFFFFGCHKIVFQDFRSRM